MTFSKLFLITNFKPSDQVGKTHVLLYDQAFIINYFGQKIWRKRELLVILGDRCQTSVMGVRLQIVALHKSKCGGLSFYWLHAKYISYIDSLPLVKFSWKNLCPIKKKNDLNFENIHIFQSIMLHYSWTLV